MENKKLIASIATCTLATNLVLASMAEAATSSNDTMTFDMNAGSLSITTPGSLTLGDATNSCSGAVDASVDDQNTCATPGVISMTDLRSSTSDVSVTIDYGNFTGSTYGQTISAAGNGKIITNKDQSTPPLTFIGQTQGPDFASITRSNYTPTTTPFTPGTPQTLYSFAKGDEYLLFKANDAVQVFLEIPGGTPADTYTNTVAFVIQ